jgi:hypothetical protein
MGASIHFAGGGEHPPAGLAQATLTVLITSCPGRPALTLTLAQLDADSWVAADQDTLRPPGSHPSAFPPLGPARLRLELSSSGEVRTCDPR